MRYPLFLFLFLFFLSCGHSGEPGCCVDPNEASASFAALGTDMEFMNAHPNPLPTKVEHSGKTINFPVEGGADGTAFLMKSHRKTNQYLILLHEWWGLNDYIKNETARWCHDLGINVIALDLYDGKVATKAEDASKLMQGCDPERARAIIDGAATYLGDSVDVRTMGWCFGGGWSLRTALAFGEKTKGCVMFYGMPEEDVDLLKTLHSDVVFVHAKKDKWITDEVVATFEENMKKADKKLTVHAFDADHAFANPSSPRFQEKEAKEAIAVVREYLKGIQ
jgi:carboxymethylenebutenolidase